MCPDSLDARKHPIDSADKPVRDRSAAVAAASSSPPSPKVPSSFYDRESNARGHVGDVGYGAAEAVGQPSYIT